MSMKWLADIIYKRLTKKNKQPDFIIGPTNDPYLSRWWIIPRNKFFNIYLHQFHRSDDDRALHDHPWWSLSLMLKGCYFEQLNHKWEIAKIRHINTGEFTFRKATLAHRLVLTENPKNNPWTLFITGPRIRQWGFHCPKGWRHWEDFTSSDGKQIGRGCD